MEIPILAPAAVLILWSLLVLFWMVSTRFPAFLKAGMDVFQADPGTRYQEVESQLPSKVNWVSHNYTHLMEQPTLFYGTVAILALVGQGVGTNVTLAWVYVGLRIIHSLWQIFVNTIPVRVGLFMLSSFFLLAMAVNAVRATLL
ncbi:MAG: hypothetical protein COC20_07775 [Cellvibrionales bacterium]|nr:MAG: hypothetical protein COC20_07775 [Cellvibrionales bacterium]